MAIWAINFIIYKHIHTNNYCDLICEGTYKNVQEEGKPENSFWDNKGKIQPSDDLCSDNGKKIIIQQTS